MDAKDMEETDKHMMALVNLRTYRGQIPASYYLHYCPVCDCIKSNDITAPNEIDEGCLDEDCVCH